MQPFLKLTSPCIYPSKKKDTGEVRSKWIFGNKTDKWSKLDSATESWDTRMKGLHHMDRPGPGLLVYPASGEDSHVEEKMQRPTGERDCTPSRAKPWEVRQAGSTHCQVGSPQTHGRIDYGGDLKVKSNKRNSHQMTENEPGLCQIMAGFKRNEFFLPGD